MSRFLIILIGFLILISCQKEEKMSSNKVVANYNSKLKSVDKISYNMRKIDTFSDGTVWDKKGKVLIEKDNTDSIFGFSYYAKNLKHNYTSIYHNYNHFGIENDAKEFEQEKAGEYVLGSPGGQMIYRDVFNFDKEVDDKSLEITESSYIITYELPDNKEFNIINRKMIIEIDKKTCLPIKVHKYHFSEIANHKQTSTYIFSDVKINENIEDNVQDKLAILADYKQILPEEITPNKLLGTQLATIELPNLISEEIEKLNSDKVLLIDFWEVWCGYCIQSFPKVDELAKKYKNLKVIGIVTENKEQAIRLVEKKGVSFTNLFGNKELLKSFHVNSFPRYFIVDKNGIIQKEYYGFSKDIEQDIKKIL